MANSYCNDKCKVCGDIIPEGESFIAQPVTLTKEGYGHYYGHERPGVKDGYLRIKYHGGGRGHRMAFHTECWGLLMENVNG